MRLVVFVLHLFKTFITFHVRMNYMETFVKQNRTYVIKSKTEIYHCDRPQVRLKNQPWKHDDYYTYIQYIHTPFQLLMSVTGTRTA